ncbi:MAG: GDSL-type esterase/lipase family protein [Pseudomonadota bacterium]
MALLLSMFIGFGVAVDNVRLAYVTSLTNMRASFIQPRYVQLGDSITAGGGVWGWRLGLDPFSAVTLARGGSTTRQINALAAPLSALKPCTIYILAGSNDVGDPRQTRANFLIDYEQLLGTAAHSGATIVATLIPPVTDPAQSARAATFNSSLRALLASRKIRTIDLWPMLAENGVMKPEYTTDGVHFSEAAYAIWTAEMRKAAAC